MARGQACVMQVVGLTPDACFFGPFPPGSLLGSIAWHFRDQTAGAGSLSPLDLHIGAFEFPSRVTTGDAANLTRFLAAQSYRLSCDTFLGNACPLLANGDHAWLPLGYEFGRLPYVGVCGVAAAGEQWTGWVGVDVTVAAVQPSGKRTRGSLPGESRDNKRSPEPPTIRRGK